MMIANDCIYSFIFHDTLYDNPSCTFPVTAKSSSETFSF